MLKRVGKFFVLLLVFALMASVLVACGSGDYKGTYYAYKNGVKQENDWIKLEKDKWSDNEGASGRLEEKDGVLYGYVVFFGEEDVLFYGTVKDGAFEYTLEGDTYYTYYTEKSKAQNKDSSLHGKTDEQGITDTPTQPVQPAKTQYTVTFDSKGGSDVASKRVNEGEKFTAPTQPTKTMYIFNGWYKESSCKNVWDFDTDVVTKDMTLYAKWQADEVRVTSVEGATIESNNITVIVNSETDYVEMYDKVVLNSDTATWKLCSDILGKYEIRTKIATNDDGTLNSGDNLFYLIVSSADETQVKTYKLNIYKKYLVPVDVYDMYENHIDAYTVYTTETLRAPSRSSFTGYVLNGWRSSEGKVGEPVPMYTYGIKLHPVATPNTYSVTLDPNGGTINTLSYTAKYDGSLYTEIPQKEGHSFLGWKYKGDYVSDNEGKCSAWKISSDATLVAEWQKNDYPVTVSVNDENAGSASVEGETLFGNTVTLVAETTNGYTFLGWYDGDTCKSTASRVNVKIPAKRTYYTAKWTYYTLTTNTNSSEAGTYTRKTEEKVTVGEEVTVTATTNAGYTWLGWYDGETKVSEGTSLNYTFTMGTENKTYTAKWYKIGIQKNISAAGTVSSLTDKYVVGDEVTVTATTNAGYTWLGWYDGETKVSEGDSLTYTFNMSAESKTYTAKWTYYTLTANGMLGNSFFSYEKVVSFDLNGASGSIPSQTIISTTGLTYPNIPTRDQYVFAGWYDNANCSGSSYDFSATVTENKTLYAKWISYTGQGIIPLNQNVSLYVYNKSSSLRYYAFVPLVSGNVTIYSTGSLDTYVYLFNSSKSQLTSDDDGGSGNNFSITYSVTAGTLYYISPCGYGSNGNTTVYISANMPSAGGVAEGNTEVGAGVAGTHTRKTEEKVTVGEEVTLTATTNNGYTWLGWYDGETKVSEGTSLTYTFNMPAENKTYTAKWIVCPVTLEMNIAEAGSVTGIYGATAVGEGTTITATTNAGYTWLGWYEGETKVSEGDSLTYTFNMPAENKTYTAKWSKITITKNNTSAGTISSLNGKYVVGDEVTVTATTNNGYTWFGWYDGETKVSEGTSLTYTFNMPAENKTYTAKWSKITITRNNTSAGTISSLNGKYVVGEEVTLTATTNAGYTWLGWYDGEMKVSEGTSLNYTFTMGTENKTYTAKWTYYTLTTNTNLSGAGTYTSKNQVKTTAGSEVTLTATTNNGYTWLGWYDGETKVSKGTSLNYTFTMGTENKTYTAKWIVCPVTLEKNIDEAGSVTGVYGATTVGEKTTVTATTNNGYTWLGWYDGETKVSEGDSLTYTFNMPAENKTYTAIWIACPVTLEKNIAEAGSVTGVYGATVVGEETTITATTNNGYTWLGWYDGETKVSEADSLTYMFNMPAESKTYTAKWELKAEMVLFDFTSTPTTCTITGIKDKSVTDIIVPDYVTNINSGAFSGCSSLQSITIPFVGNRAGVTSSDTYQYPFGYIFGISRYTGGTATKQYYYGSSTTSTTYTTYYIPSNLKSVTVTGGNILYYAFRNCSNLTSITLPDSVTSIGVDAFRDCSSLTSITIPDSVTSIGSEAFYKCSSLTSITLPDSVTSIGREAFTACSSLTSVTIGDSVTSIGSSAFWCCYHLVEVYNKSSLNIVKGSSGYGDVGRYAKAVYTEEYTSKLSTDSNGYVIYTDGEKKSLIMYTGEETELTLPEGITEINQYAFYENNKITSVTIPASVTIIGNYAFYDCYRLVEVYNKSSLNITKGSTAKEYIGYYAKTIYTEEYTSKLSTDSNGYVIYTDGEEKSLIMYTGEETELTLPEGITEINQYAFYGNNKITSITIPNSVTSIGSYAFSGCTATIAWGKNPAITTTIGSYAFSEYNGTSITIPDSVTSIGEYAFEDCYSLKSITIPDSVTSIGNYSFCDCFNLTSITFQGTKAQWNAISKGSSWNYNSSYTVMQCTVHCTDGNISK